MNKETTWLRSHKAFAFGTEEDKNVILEAIDRGDVNKYYVCPYIDLDEVTPVSVESSTNSYLMAKKYLLDYAKRQMAQINDVIDDPDAQYDMEDMADLCVLYMPDTDTFIQFAEDFETIVGIHPAEFLHQPATYKVHEECAATTEESICKSDCQ
jgi:hypothetical protein